MPEFARGRNRSPPRLPGTGWTAQPRATPWESWRFYSFALKGRCRA